jgi:PKD repeat protein
MLQQKKLLLRLLFIFSLIGAPASLSASLSAKFYTSISNSTVKFKDTSTHSTKITRCAWNFGDGSTSTSFDPTHTYSKSGTYYVCYTIYDAIDSSKYCDSVKVIAPCNAMFSYGSTMYTYYFKNSSTGTLTNFYWDFGDGNSDTARFPTHTYKKVGGYTVCLTVYDTNNACKNTYCDTFKIVPPPCNADFKYYDTAMDVIFSNTSKGWANKYQWSFGDGTSSTKESPVHHYTKAGYYTACLTINDTINKCSDSFCQVIKVRTSCSASFNYADSGNRTFQFVNTSSANTKNWYWEFGDSTTSKDASPLHTYAKEGYYHVCLTTTDSSGTCTNKYCVTIGVFTCKASFTYKIIGDTVYFTNTTSGDNFISKTTWYFGDGDSSHDLHAKHVYSSGGIYNVCLKVYKSTNSCNSTTCQNITFTKNCFASFTYNDSALKYTFKSKVSTNINSWYWDFGDGTTSTDPNPVHTFPKYGSYKVSLEVQDTGGICKSYYIIGIIINRCSAKYSYLTKADSVIFSLPYSSSSATYSWNFGDGTTSNLAKPYHLFASTGYYYVCLYLSDSIKGCASYYCDSIHFIKPAYCDVSFSNKKSTSNNLKLDFTSKYTKNITDLVWNFGDGDTLAQDLNSVSGNPSHTYSASGHYVVSLTGYDKVNGCIAYYNDTITVNDLCRDSFSYWTKCTYTYFTAYSNTGKNSTYQWSLGDGTTGSGKGEDHTYANGGTYYVCLTVTDSSGTCSSTYCDSITIKAPNTHAAYKYVIKGNKVQFVNKSTGNITNYLWYFGDGTSSDLNDPEHTFASNGNYKVCLHTIDSVSGCSDIYCDSFTIDNSSCYTTFSKYDINNKKVVFKMTPLKNVTYTWYFGDGDSATNLEDTIAHTMSHVYSEYGKYEVVLKAKGSDGCESSYTVRIGLAGHTISGNLTRGTSNFYSHYIVYLIKYNPADSTLKAIDTLKVDGTGDSALYAFSPPDTGVYYVKAALRKDDSLYSDYIPTYYGDEFQWGDATAIHLVSSNLTADIDLLSGTNTFGSGFISGKVSQGANKKEGDPLKDIQVMLTTTDGIPVRYTYSTSDGSYGFENLEFGSYKVFAEIPGLAPMASVVILSEENPKEEDVNIVVNTNTVVTSIRNKYNAGDIRSAKLYPNPADNLLYMDIDLTQGHNAILELYNATGQLIRMETKTLSGTQQTIQIPVDNLPQGLYMLQLKTGNGSYWEQKFIKL